jgi:hypothetical protein
VVDVADVDARLKEIAEKTGKHLAKVKVDYQGEKREQLESSILEQKLVDHLLSKAKISDEVPGAERLAADKAEAASPSGESTEPKKEAKKSKSKKAAKDDDKEEG